MIQTSKIFRIFVSSTFTDLKEERNTLQKDVFPRLRDLCREHNCRFQAIDLRWGISEEAGLDQQTMKICLEEIERCQKITPKPNFIVLLGDRYGWRPVPYQIPAKEFHEIYNLVNDEKDQELLDEWFRLDDNAVPPVYELQPRTVKYVDYDTWLEVENQLNSLLCSAVLQLDLTDENKRKYFASAIEQEITKGLESEDAYGHVFGYFRELKNLPSTLTSEYVEQDNNSRERLNVLKEQLKKKITCRFHAVDWTDINDKERYLRELGDDVYRSLSEIILKQIDQFDLIDPLDQEIQVHSYFGQERSKNFTGRTEILEEIEHYIKSGREEPFAIQGIPGSGKTALMTYAAQKVKKEHPDIEVIYRFIGATPTSSDIRSLLESLCQQISVIYNADKNTIPTTYSELVKEFPIRIHLATPEKPLIIFLDALDQISEFENARNLIWLPLTLPKHVRLIVSTAPGEILEVLERRTTDKNIITLHPMSKNEGEKLLSDWLHEAQRTLQAHQKNEVIHKFTTNGNPFYLRLAFDESLIWKSYSDPQKTVLSPDISGIIRDLFKRLSSEKNHGKMVFYRTLGYLAASRYGLSEDEIIDLLSSDKDVFHDFMRRARSEPTEILTNLQSILRKDKAHLTENKELFIKLKKDPKFSDDIFERAKHEKILLKLPLPIWSRLYFDLEPYLRQHVVHEASLFTFYNRQILDVVTKKCLKPELEKYYHVTLAEYFDSGKIYHRELDEVPWQLDKAQSWERLKDFITYIPAFSDMIGQERFNEMMIYWRDIGDRYNMVEYYKNALEPCRIAQISEQTLLTYYTRVARFLFVNDHYDAAESLFKEALSRTEKIFGQKHVKTAEILDDLAGLFSKKGEYIAATRLSERSLKILEEVLEPDALQTATALNSLALNYSTQGDFEKAKRLYERSLEIKENKLGLDQYSTALTLQNLGLLFWSKGEYRQAEVLYNRALPIMEKNGKENLDNAILYNNLGLVYHANKEYGKSLEFYKKSFEIRKKILGMDNIDTANSMFNCACLMMDQKQYERAESLYRKALAICETNLEPNHRLLMTVLSHLAQLLGLVGNYDEAITCYNKALVISTNVYGINHPNTSLIYTNLRLLENMSNGRKKPFWKFW
jgi:tetratricopeptide (TPR) repeat protein/DNA polymerase III delta prime subunit